MLGFPTDEIDFTGINYNSPTIQAMMGGMGNIPPSPVGTPINIGGVEYVHDPTLLQQAMYDDSVRIQQENMAYQQQQQAYGYGTPMYQQPYGYGYQQPTYQQPMYQPVQPVQQPQQEAQAPMSLNEQIFGMQSTINIQSQQQQQTASMYQPLLQFQPPYGAPMQPMTYQQPMAPGGFPMNPPYGYQQQPMPIYQQPGMMGYYNTQNRNFGNPYMDQQYANYQQTIMREQQRKQSDVMKMLSNVVHNGLGDKEEIGDFDAFLSRQYDPPEINREAYEDEMNYNRLCNIVPYPETNQAFLAYAANVRAESQKDFPDSMGLFEFLENGGLLVQKCYEDRAKQVINNGKKEYDSKHFKDIVHSNVKSKEASVYFNSALLGKGKATLTGDSLVANIDDMEITYPLGGGQPSIVVTLPDHLKKYDERRREFFNAITGAKRSAGG